MTPPGWDGIEDGLAQAAYTGDIAKRGDRAFCRVCDEDWNEAHSLHGEGCPVGLAFSELARLRVEDETLRDDRDWWMNHAANLLVEWRAETTALQARVVVLERERDEAWVQKRAAEWNLSVARNEQTIAERERDEAEKALRTLDDNTQYCYACEQDKGNEKHTPDCIVASALARVREGETE